MSKRDTAVSAEAWSELVRDYLTNVDDRNDDAEVAALLRDALFRVEGIR